MRAILVAVAVLRVSGAAATTVTQTFVGTVAGAQTTDTDGLFGPAGASLKGAAVTIRTRYVSGQLPDVHKCRINPSACTYDSTGTGTGSPGAVTTSFTIGGRTVSYDSTIYGDVVFDNANQNRFVPETNVLSGQSQGGSGSAVNVSFAAPVKFGRQLAPADAPVANRSDLMSFFKLGDTYASESLTFVVTKASR